MILLYRMKLKDYEKIVEKLDCEEPITPRFKAAIQLAMEIISKLEIEMEKLKGELHEAQKEAHIFKNLYKQMCYKKEPELHMKPPYFTPQEKD